MDFCQNVTVSGEYYQQEQVLPPCSKLGAALTHTSPLDDLFTAQNTEVDVDLEWLSVFVEDCLSSTGNCLPAPTIENTNTAPKTPKDFHQKPSFLERFVVPGKARSKRKRVISAKIRNNALTSWSYYNNQTLHFPSSDPPLLQQTHWLADSELVVPKKARDCEVQLEETRNVEVGVEGEAPERVMGSRGKGSLVILENSSGRQQQQQQPRRCTHCLAQRTPQWRAGPFGPKTLCNACGVRYKSGRLLPEYRPAKSPTFVSYLHSNSHKKVMEMRMASSAAHS